jgi:hypothetical protein
MFYGTEVKQQWALSTNSNIQLSKRSSFANAFISLKTIRTCMTRLLILSSYINGSARRSKYSHVGKKISNCEFELAMGKEYQPG